jgi:diguanylate cyclase (GGDEF)-like protein/PAS domain S-box-containing protein
LFNGQEVIGVLGMAHTEPERRFDETTFESLGRFAQLAAIALDNARLHAQVRDELRERERAEVQLRESERRYRLMFDSSPLPMWIYDADTLCFLAVNDAAVAHYGYTRDTFLAMTLRDIRPPEEIPRLEAALAEPGAEKGLLARHRKKDGTVIDVEIIAHDLLSDHGQHWLVLANDVTERVHAEEALRHNALHDALTGLPNRTLFAERLTHALDRATCDVGYRFAVLYLDFDRFKYINDSLGHLEGDQVLIEGARRLARYVQPQDTLARLGGDEFVILLDDLSDADDPIAVANLLACTLAAPIPLRGQEVVIAASIGVVLGAPHYRRPDEVIRDADIAMYEAKATGKGRAVVFDAAMHARVVARMCLENDLRRAIENDDLAAWYHPIVSLVSGRIVGVEAVTRWRHPEIGPIASADFIPLAEETGLIVPIGRWVLREACCQLRSWDEQSPTHQHLSVSVNVSARELLQAGFVTNVRTVLCETGLEPRRLTLEITERALVDEVEAVAATLQALSDTGVRIHLDHFGMGYSSLSYLHRFPIDVLKVDRSFVSARGQPEIANGGIVRAIIALAHTLHIAVAAEGIETTEQRQQLTALGCEYGQGNQISPPLAADVTTHWLEQYLRGSASSETGGRRIPVAATGRDSNHISG